MLVENLQQYLAICSPDYEVRFQFGNDDMYRKTCAKMIAEQPNDIDFRDDVTPMLEYLEISEVKIDISRKEIVITFIQGYIKDECIRERYFDFKKERKVAGSQK